MTDTKKKREPRELAPGKAIAMLQAIDEEHGKALKIELDAAVKAAELRVNAKYQRRRLHILSRVHETARAGVEAEAARGRT